jgi:SAM-dependent methyltransferase
VSDLIWMGDVTPADRRVLGRCLAPVLDAGCGPGRHAHALAYHGVPALGVDISEHLLDLARAKGAAVLQRSIFDRLPATGRWGTVLLLDGNLGIGGDPVALLRRVTELVRPGGRIIVEFDAPGSGLARSMARVELDGRPGPWFGWARVGACQAQSVVERTAELRLLDRWQDEGRWFAELERCGP